MKPEKIRFGLEWRDKNIKTLAKEVLKPDTPVKKLIKKEQTELRASEINDLKRLEIVAKHHNKRYRTIF
ncbi:hypothetical protein DHW03_16050 [Pedobacter yonginense]|uniref:Uncharacterized protein n=1 Tax=Pedobacter yonginense TaxID=651869 RepID=A0A317EMM6_9SPHI|nr:hypothetical protein [Pedobacter yonginense]PWS26298.1 hypothetical protein DHW03_16050 [Pedobacter yonginense]